MSVRAINAALRDPATIVVATVIGSRRDGPRRIIRARTRGGILQGRLRHSLRWVAIGTVAVVRMD
jgi:hypothetical protein